MLAEDDNDDVQYVHVTHDGFVKKGSENEFEHLQSRSITLTPGCNYLCSNAQIEKATRIRMNVFKQWAAPCLTVIKSANKAKNLKNRCNYFSQNTWKSKSYCSSTYRLHELQFRPLIGSIIAKGINSMTPSLSGTHTLNDQELLQINQPKRTMRAPWKRAAKTSHGSRRQLPQEECSPLHLADEILVRCKTKKWRGKKKNPSPITVTLKRFGSPLDNVWGVVWMERWQKRGKWIIDSNYTDLRFSALRVTGLFSVLSL